MRHPKRERRRAVELRRQRPELQEGLDFLRKLAEAASDLVTPAADPPGKDAPAGFPPLFPAHFPLDESAAAEAFEVVTRLFVETSGSEQARDALAALDSGRLHPIPLVRAYCAADASTFQSSGRELGLDPGLLVQLAELAVKPQFIAAAAVLESPEPSLAADPVDRCPVCGSPPDMAYITDERDVERVMVAVCQLCESEWPIRRVRCLKCGNEDDETLTYLHAEDEEEARVNICERCGHYLPVVDARGRLEVAPAVERVGLAHLDVVAQERGYRPLTVLLAQMAGHATD